MHTTKALPDMRSDTRSDIAQCPLVARDWTRSMRRPPRGVEVHDDRFAAVEQREADEEAILDALDVAPLAPIQLLLKLLYPGPKFVGNGDSSSLIICELCALPLERRVLDPKRVDLLFLVYCCSSCSISPM